VIGRGTTVPSYYHETRSSPEAITWRRGTRRWWDRYRHAFELTTSDVTLEELERAPRHKSRPGAAMLSGVRVLGRDASVADAARYYLDHKLVPKEAVADALHLAIASRHSIDFLLSWNIQHLANPNKARHLAVLNRRLKLSTPTLITPLTLIPEVGP
jgi:hypothetical protein